MPTRIIPHQRRRRWLFIAALCLFLPQCGLLQQEEHGLVAVAHPEAARAAVEILQAGGSALDAGIAAQAMLTLVEPQSSGLGGGAFLLYWDEGEKKLFAYDGRETAPEAISPDVFLDDDGKPLDFFQAVPGGRSVGVPGVVAMLGDAHRLHGQLAWRDLFAPAQQKAEQGFALSPRLHEMLARDPLLPRLPQSAALFYDDDGTPLPVGTLIKNPQLAQSLATLAQEGAQSFYTGTIAEQILSAVREAPINPGLLSARDLSAYRARMREPLCRPYREVVVCGFPPPTSGGVAVLQILGMVEKFNLSLFKPGRLDEDEGIHFISEASRIAYADRAHYLADPDFVSVPVQQLLSRDYLKARAREIDFDDAHPAPQPGQFDDVSLAPANADIALPSTTHFSIRDKAGNLLSMTSSIEAPFGSHIMSGGFFLNNQLTDFSFLPERDGKPIANAAAPGKRPLSSMAPIIVFNQEGEPVAALGSPGGRRIIAYVVQTLIALIDWGLSPQSAVSLPRHVAMDKLELEEGTELARLRADSLKRMGHEVEIKPLTSGLHVLAKQNGRWRGGADPRREGVVLSDVP